MDEVNGNESPNQVEGRGFWGSNRNRVRVGAAAGLVAILIGGGVWLASDSPNEEEGGGAPAGPSSTTTAPPESTPSYGPDEPSLKDRPDKPSVEIHGRDIKGGTLDTAFVDYATLEIRSSAQYPTVTFYPSVVKLMIADDIFWRTQTGEISASDYSTGQIDEMIRSNNNDAAEELWNRFGKTDIIDRISQRYNITGMETGSSWAATKMAPDQAAMFVNGWAHHAYTNDNRATDYTLKLMYNHKGPQLFGVHKKNPGFVAGSLLTSVEVDGRLVQDNVVVWGPENRFSAAGSLVLDPGEKPQTSRLTNAMGKLTAPKVPK